MQITYLFLLVFLMIGIGLVLYGVVLEIKRMLKKR